MNKYLLQELFLEALCSHYKGGGYTHGLEIAYLSNGNCQLTLRVGPQPFMCQCETDYEKALVNLASRWIGAVLPLTPVLRLERYLWEKR